MTAGEPAYVRPDIEDMRPSSLVRRLAHAPHPRAAVGICRTLWESSGGAGPGARQSGAALVRGMRRGPGGSRRSAVDASPALVPCMAVASSALRSANAAKIPVMPRGMQPTLSRDDPRESARPEGVARGLTDGVSQGVVCFRRSRAHGRGCLRGPPLSPPSGAPPAGWIYAWCSGSTTASSPEHGRASPRSPHPWPSPPPCVDRRTGAPPARPLPRPSRAMGRGWEARGHGGMALAKALLRQCW
jgi:hypothetical protein